MRMHNKKIKKYSHLRTYQSCAESLYYIIVVTEKELNEITRSINIAESVMFETATENLKYASYKALEAILKRASNQINNKSARHKWSSRGGNNIYSLSFDLNLYSHFEIDTDESYEQIFHEIYHDECASIMNNKRNGHLLRFSLHKIEQINSEKFRCSYKVSAVHIINNVEDDIIDVGHVNFDLHRNLGDKWTVENISFLLNNQYYGFDYTVINHPEDWKNNLLYMDIANLDSEYKRKIENIIATYEMEDYLIDEDYGQNYFD